MGGVVESISAMTRVSDNKWKCGPMGSNSVVSLGSRCLYHLSHLTSPTDPFFWLIIRILQSSLAFKSCQLGGKGPFPMGFQAWQYFSILALPIGSVLTSCTYELLSSSFPPLPASKVLFYSEPHSVLSLILLLSLCWSISSGSLLIITFICANLIVSASAFPATSMVTWQITVSSYENRTPPCLHRKPAHGAGVRL